MTIKNILICGLGAVGLTYADKLHNISNLKILADKNRVERYKKNPLKLNGKEIKLNYVLPGNGTAQDLIIIAVKYNGLKTAIEYLDGFVGKDTIIISLINGITSEKEIADVYGSDKVLHSYFIGHSAVREVNCVTQDGVGKIVFGSPYKENQNKVAALKEFFEQNNIDYSVPDDIIYSLWLKFTLNLFSNQLSAILNLTFGEMKKSDNFKKLAKKVIEEVKIIGEKEGVKNLENLEKESMQALSKMIDSGKTSMLQDMLAGRKTEVDIFAGEIIKLGKKHGIETPYNYMMYEMIKLLEEK